MMNNSKIKNYLASGWAALTLQLATVAVLAISEYGTSGFVSIALQIVAAIMFFSSLLLASVAYKKQAASKPTN